MKTLSRLLPCWSALTFLSLSASSGFAQGTVQFFNSALSRLLYQDVPGSLIVTCPPGIKVGLFWGTDSAGAAAITGLGRGTLATPTISTTEGGIFYGSAVYAIQGTQEGQRVWLKVAAWNRSDDNFAQATHYAESQVVSVLLAPTAGPGTVIFQSATGTATDRIKPFALVTIPEPSFWALGLQMLPLLFFRRRNT